MFQARIWKGFLLRFVMTAGVSLWASFRIGFGTGAYIGNYDDMTPAWFQNIGFSLLITLLFKVFGQIASSGLDLLFRAVRIFWDRKFSFNGSLTRQLTHEEYVKVYSFSEFEIDFGYSEIINIIFVTMILSPILPAISILSFAYLLLMYWREKLVCKTWFKLTSVLKFSKLPHHYDESLSTSTRNLMALSLPASLVICIWIFGNPSVIEVTSSSYNKLVEGRLMLMVKTTQSIFKDSLDR